MLVSGRRETMENKIADQHFIFPSNSRSLSPSLAQQQLIKLTHLRPRDRYPVCLDTCALTSSDDVPVSPADVSTSCSLPVAR